jgi:hypothetical protein
MGRHNGKLLSSRGGGDLDSRKQIRCSKDGSKGRKETEKEAKTKQTVQGPYRSSLFALVLFHSATVLSACRIITGMRGENR